MIPQRSDGIGLHILLSLLGLAIRHRLSSPPLLDKLAQRDSIVFVIVVERAHVHGRIPLARIPCAAPLRLARNPSDIWAELPLLPVPVVVAAAAVAEIDDLLGAPVAPRRRARDRAAGGGGAPGRPAARRPEREVVLPQDLELRERVREARPDLGEPGLRVGEPGLRLGEPAVARGEHPRGRVVVGPAAGGPEVRHELRSREAVERGVAVGGAGVGAGAGGHRAGAGASGRWRGAAGNALAPR